MMTRAWLRWIPAAAVPAVIAAGVLSGSLPASAGGSLPDTTPQEVLQLIARHSEKSLSGTLEQSSGMGLPELPKSGAGAETAWLELLTGPHTARIYLDGAERARVQVLDRLAERNAVRNGNDLWFYNSRDNTAAHAQLPAGTGVHHSPRTGTPTPAELADKLLAKLDPSTEVTLAADSTVAGRAAYNLVLTPKSGATLLDTATIAVDGENGLPLGVTLRARGQSDPAFSIAYTSLKLEAPDPAVFNFTPPAGATVEEIPVPEHQTGTAAPQEAAAAKAAKRPTATGTGWETVLEFPAGTATLPGAAAAQTKEPDLSTGNPLQHGRDANETRPGAAALLEQAAVAVPGGRLLSTSLVNVLILDDGRILAGSVPLERLQAAAAQR